jgi:hypothetical protein
MYNIKKCSKKRGLIAFSFLLFYGIINVLERGGFYVDIIVSFCLSVSVVGMLVFFLYEDYKKGQRKTY